MPLFERFLYWGGTMIGSWAIAMVSLGIIVGILRRFSLSQNLMMIVGAIISAAPIALFIKFIVPFVFDDGNRLSFILQYLYALPITLTFALMTNLLLGVESTSQKIAPEDENANALLARIPVEKRGPLKYMSAEDHYVKVVTTRGNEMVLMRMADAESAVAHLAGVRIHRSHWVNKEYAVSHDRRNGQPYVTMDDGTELPVSRSYTKQAREAGLI